VPTEWDGIWTTADSQRLTSRPVHRTRQASTTICGGHRIAVPPGTPFSFSCIGSFDATPSIHHRATGHFRDRDRLHGAYQFVTAPSDDNSYPAPSDDDDRHVL